MYAPEPPALPTPLTYALLCTPSSYRFCSHPVLFTESDGACLREQGPLPCSRRFCSHSNLFTGGDRWRWHAPSSRHLRELLSVCGRCSWGFGVLFVSCVCRCRGCCSLLLCVCVCVWHCWSFYRRWWARLRPSSCSRRFCSHRFSSQEVMGALAEQGPSPCSHRFCSQKQRNKALKLAHAQTIHHTSN